MTGEPEAGASEREWHDLMCRLSNVAGLSKFIMARGDWPRGPETSAMETLNRELGELFRDFVRYEQDGLAAGPKGRKRVRP